MNHSKTDDFARIIAERLVALDAEDALGHEGRAVVSLDQQAVGRLSRQDALLSQSMSKATQARRDAQRQALERARDRMKVGAFGYCDACGEDIAPKRLELDPSVTLCISCASGRM